MNYFHPHISMVLNQYTNPIYQSYVMHYHNKLNPENIFPGSEDEEEDFTTSTRYESKANSADSNAANAKTSKDKYYQTAEDKLHAPVDGDTTNTAEYCDEDIEKVQKFSNEVPTVE